jgi:hypothetical protein
MLTAVNNLLSFIGDASQNGQISDRELTFASWHLVGALESPKDYV